jgi:UDP-glucose 4-epimerase
MTHVSKVLVTGGSGFIGSYVIERLLRDGLSVVVLDHSVPADSERIPEVSYFLGDIRDEVAVTEAMAHVDGFIHLAGVLGTQETISNPRPAVMTNIVAGLNVLEAAAQYDVPGVNIAVGNHWENNPYSISKSTVERLVHMFNDYRGTQVSIVRALNAYGPRQSVSAPYGTSKVRKIMPSFIQRALHEDDIEVYGDGSQVMDMIYVSDVADFLVDALYATAATGFFKNPIEAGTGRNTTVLDIARQVIHHTGSGQITHLPLRPGETPGAVVKADTSTQEILYGTGKKRLIPLEQGIAKTVAYYRKNFK